MNVAVPGECAEIGTLLKPLRAFPAARGVCSVHIRLVLVVSDTPVCCWCVYSCGEVVGRLRPKPEAPEVKP